MSEQDEKRKNRAETFKRNSKAYYERFEHLSLRIPKEVKEKLQCHCNKTGESINTAAVNLLTSALRLLEDGEIRYKEPILPARALSAFEAAGFALLKDVVRFIMENPGWCSGESTPRIKNIGNKTALETIDRLYDNRYLSKAEWIICKLNIDLAKSFNAEERSRIIAEVRRGDRKDLDKIIDEASRLRESRIKESRKRRKKEA